MSNCTPLLAAVAALLVAITPGMVAALAAFSNRSAIARVESATNGHLADQRAEVARLQAALLDAARKAPAEREPPHIV